MTTLRDWARLLRFEEYAPLFLLCPIAGAIVARGSPTLPLLTSLVFVLCVSASAFAENDILDVEEDSHRPVVRNPIATGVITRRRAAYLFVLFAAVSFATLATLPLQAVLLGLLSSALWWGYSFVKRFWAVPLLAVGLHGAVPPLFCLIGYALFAGLSAWVALLGFGVFCFATMSCVLQEVRDQDYDRLFRRTTATTLGETKSVDICLALLLLGAAAVAVAGAADLSPYMLLFVPACYFLVGPLLSLRRHGLTAEKAISQLRNRGMVIAVVSVVFSLLLGA